MRKFLGALAATLFLSVTVHAAEVEGLIKSIDKDAATITLDDGKDYKLPGEFDVDTLKVGNDIVLAYDEVAGEKLITDMQISEVAE